jgi:anhydro-N-acetylmuramic acid kinase
MLLKKKHLSVLGLMSGTSLDGLDLALCRIRKQGNGYKLCTTKTRSLDYPISLRQKILKQASDLSLRKSELMRLNNELVDFYLRGITRFTDDNPCLKPDLIGSHGQTIYHADRRLAKVSDRTTGSWQIVDGAMLSARTGVPVVSDFRVNDVALGGSGAPLMPVCHYHMFNNSKANLAVLNIGGISNLTWLPGGGRLEDIQSSDCGPGNMLVDALMNRLYNRKFDEDGKVALSGTVSGRLLAWFKRHGWYKSAFPKSLGREQFGDFMVQKLISAGENLMLKPDDIIATTTRFTVEAVMRYIECVGSPEILAVCGGGAQNLFMINSLVENLPECDVVSSDDFNIDPSFVEAAGFALLAVMFLHNRPAGLPQVTGAKRATVLGKLSLP